MKLKDRLKQARKHRKMTQAGLSEATNLDQTTISNLETGKVLSTSKLVEIAYALNVNAHWLATGQGSMTDEADEQHANVSAVEQPAAYYRYPVISSVRAGKFSECVVPYPTGMEEVYEATDYQAKGHAFWLEVEGDSMTAPAGMRPSIPEGTFVLVDTGIEAMPGKLVVAQLDESNEATFKKLIVDSGQKYLKALNPAYPLIPINGNCRIIGVAIEAKTKL